MKKVLGLVFSERRLGNSEILVKEIMSRVPEPCTRELIRVTELDLKPCRACYRCLQPDTPCRIEDDFNYIIDRIKQSDALVMGVPVYFLGCHASYKILTDRLLGAGHLAGYTLGKPCVIVIPYGREGWTGYSRCSALVLPRVLQMKLAALWSVHAALPGECLLDERDVRHAAELGSALFELPECQPGPTECLRCGSDQFRILRDGGVECTLCMTRHGIKLEDGRQALVLDSGEEEKVYSFSPEGIAEHFSNWLPGMKEMFLNKHDQLKEVQKSYKEKKWWVKPRP